MIPNWKYRNLEFWQKQVNDNQNVGYPALQQNNMMAVVGAIYALLLSMFMFLIDWRYQKFFEEYGDKS